MAWLWNSQAVREMACRFCEVFWAAAVDVLRSLHVAGGWNVALPGANVAASVWVCVWSGLE
jgi:hypothetical protein